MRSVVSERAPVWALLATLLACGCAGSDAMVEILAPLPELPAGGNAVVVFIRPSTYAESDRFPILDQSGRFLGHSLPATWFETQLPAGRYTFFARGENTAAVRAYLAPDRTYFIEVGPRLGWLSARVQLFPIAPRWPSWAKREEWLAESTALRLEDAGASNLDPDDLAAIVQRGFLALGSYDDDELERRTLRPGDGI